MTRIRIYVILEEGFVLLFKWFWGHEFVLYIFIFYLTFVLCNKKKINTHYSWYIKHFQRLVFGVINYYGLLSIALFYGISYTYFKNNYRISILRFLHLLLLLLASVYFAMHIVPGFYNDLVLDKVNVSLNSAAFSMYLNFDKTIAGIILFISSNLYKNEKLLNLKSLAITLIFCISCSSLLMISGVLSNYIEFDFKIPNFILIWFINNLFFVCLTEEVLFRGVIQNKLKGLNLGRYIPYIHVILASIIFGLVHFKAGVLYILLSCIAGIFYGLAYEMTGRVLCAILVHFFLNFVHIIFFTYPSMVKA